MMFPPFFEQFHQESLVDFVCLSDGKNIEKLNGRSMNPPPPRLSFVYKIEVRKCPVQIMWEEMWVDEQCVVFVISIYYTYYYIYKYIYNFFMLSILLGPRTTNCQNRLIKVHIRCKFQIAFRVFIQTPLAHASQDWRNLHQHFHWQLLCPRKVADVATEQPN